MIKTMIFDVDGTLVHTRPEYVIKTVNRALKDLGKYVEAKEIMKFWFAMDRDGVVRSWGVDVDDFWTIFREYDVVEDRTKYIAAYDDVHVLKKLKSKNIKIAALSNAPPNVLSMNLEKIPYGFDCVYDCFSSGIRPKPDPHGIEECMRMTGAKKNETIMVGNGLEDHLAAKAAGVVDYIVERNEHDVHIPSKNKIQSLGELLRLV